MATANDVLTGRGERLPLPGQATTMPATRAGPGRAGLSGKCFGDYLTRSGIGVPVRELLTFALLAALGGCDAQVRGHVAVNLNVGNSRQALIGVLTVLVPFIGYPRRLNALAAVNEVAPASQEGQ